MPTVKVHLGYFLSNVVKTEDSFDDESDTSHPGDLSGLFSIVVSRHPRTSLRYEGRCLDESEGYTMTRGHLRLLD